MVPSPARRRTAFNIRLNLEALEDRLPPGQATQLSAASVGLLGILDLDESAIPVHNVSVWAPVDRDAGVIGSFGGGLNDDTIVEVDEPTASSSGRLPIEDPVLSAPEGATAVDSSRVDSGADLENLSLLDSVTIAATEEDEPWGAEPDDWATGPVGGASFGGVIATGTAPATPGAVSSFSGHTFGTPSGTNSPAPGAAQTAASADTSVPSPARSEPGLSSGIYGPPVPEPTVEVTRVTARNRNTPTMSGGWNPALRSIMLMNDGSRWFAAETGTDVHTNTAMVYYRFGPGGWRAVGSVVLPTGIQQNMATITDGRFIYSYGCTRNWLIEARFDSTRPRWNLAAGNAITTRGRLIHPGAAANYVGAAWHNNTRIIWWTSVGLNGSGGLWAYAYNTGNGWHKPVITRLGKYNDVGYVRARFDDDSQIQLIGEGYRGAFPAGRRYLVAATLVLGNKCRWAPVLPRDARSPLDLWREPGDAATHLLYRMSPKLIGYSFGTSGTIRPTAFAATTARFISDDKQLGLVLGYKRYVEVRLVARADASGPIDWAAVPAITITLPKALRSGGVSAVWTVDESRQAAASDRLEFAICGGYPVRDNLIYSVSVNRA